jgi:hypothetical protein
VSLSQPIAIHGGELLVSLAMSLDETCRVHLVCVTPEGPQYWAVDMDGQRAVEARRHGARLRLRPRAPRIICIDE